MDEMNLRPKIESLGAGRMVVSMGSSDWGVEVWSPHPIRINVPTAGNDPRYPRHNSNIKRVIDETPRIDEESLESSPLKNGVNPGKTKKVSSAGDALSLFKI